MTRIQQDLLAMETPAYRQFHKKLIPTVKEELIIGIPVPQLRQYAKKMGNEKSGFLLQLPHRYYEENMLHGLLLCQEKEIEPCLEKLNAFLPFVDNWAVCDSIRPKCLGKNKERLLQEIIIWMNSGHNYTLRFAIQMLMVHFFDEAFQAEYIHLVARVKSDDYYVNMMIAWYFATALAKQWESTFPYIKTHRLSPFVHHKTIQKAVESFRISSEQKQQLKQYRNFQKKSSC